MIRFAFFGTSPFSVAVLDELEKQKLAPALVVTAPDRPKGRNLLLSAPETKIWAEKRGIPVLQPEALDAAAIEAIRRFDCDLFLVASYGKIIPKALLDAAPRGALNIHPSLLPALRGATPIQSALLSGATGTGVTLIKMDEKMDHGPIIGFIPYPLAGDEFYPELEVELARLGARLFVGSIDGYLAGSITPREQDHENATFTKKIEKADGALDLEADPQTNWRKIRAYAGTIGTYFFAKRNGKKIRVTVKKASLKDGKLAIERVLPESRKEMTYDDFRRAL